MPDVVVEEDQYVESHNIDRQTNTLLDCCLHLSSHSYIGFLVVLGTYRMLSCQWWFAVSKHFTIT